MSEPALTVHSSELCNPCPQQAVLRLEGKEIREAPTALTRGLVSHEALERVCDRERRWALASTAEIVDEAWDAVLSRLRDEGRDPTAAVIAGEAEIVKEVVAVVGRYRSVIAPYAERIVGNEIPVSTDIEVDGQTVRFESHIDHVFIGPDPLGEFDRCVCVFDFKHSGVAPSPAYLARNLQLGMYHYATTRGDLIVDGWRWVDRPDLPVRTYWVHLPYLKPYGRKTTVTEDGEPVEYAKGDARPMHRVLNRASVTDEGKLLHRFRERTRMMLADLWPALPTPDGCRLCNSKHACVAHGAYN